MESSAASLAVDSLASFEDDADDADDGAAESASNRRPRRTRSGLGPRASGGERQRGAGFSGSSAPAFASSIQRTTLPSE